MPPKQNPGNDTNFKKKLIFLKKNHLQNHPTSEGIKQRIKETKNRQKSSFIFLSSFFFPSSYTYPSVGIPCESFGRVFEGGWVMGLYWCDRGGWPGLTPSD
jgi:hypothetical protein